MGSMKREYRLLKFNLGVKTRTVKETLQCIPIDKSCALAMDLVHLACQKLRSAVTQRREIDCEQITREMCELMHKHIESGFDGECPDNLPGNIKFFYLPKIEGGDNYNSHIKAVDKNIGFDIIQIAAGVNYKSYYSNFVRTLLINPTKNIKIAYTFSVLLKRVILFHLRDGVELRKVYDAVIIFAKRHSQDLTNHLKKEFGFALSHIFEDDLVINSTTKGIAKYGMTFSMNVNLIGLKEGNTVYNICNSDTVLVRKSDPAEMLTSFQRSNFNTLIEDNNHS